MKTNKKTVRSAMDARLSFLDELPSCRAAVQYRIAQEEEPVMKKKISLGLVFAIVLVLLTAAALATTLLLSPRADAVRTADRALEEKYGVTAEMQTYFDRRQEDQPDGSVKVTYAGFGALEYPLGVYTAAVKDGRAEVTWSHDGEDTSGGYEAEAWGLEQLKQMTADSLDEKLKQAYLDRAEEITADHGIRTEYESGPADKGYFERLEAEKTEALNARKIPEEEMIAAAREFIISNYGLDEEQVSRLELYTNSVPEWEAAEVPENDWYEMVNGKPCFKVEYLLYQDLTTEQVANGESLPHAEKDGFYNVFVNVETGEIEEFAFNSGLAGQG